MTQVANVTQRDVLAAADAHRNAILAEKAARRAAQKAQDEYRASLAARTAAAQAIQSSRRALDEVLERAAAGVAA